jgi:hypothetical protein
MIILRVFMETTSFYPMLDRQPKEHPEDVPHPAARTRVAANISACATAVFFYHPLTTMVNRMINGHAFTYHVRDLYRGFMPAVLASHQLIVMGMIESAARNYLMKKNKREMTTWDRFMVASLAGISSVFTVTPVEVMVIQKQKPGNTAAIKHIAWKMFQSCNAKELWRGFTPMLFRQWGLGLGIYFFPHLVRSTSEPLVTHRWRQEHPTSWNFICSIAGGIFGTAITHVPNIVRVRMQDDLNRSKYQSSFKAFRDAVKDFKIPTEWKRIKASFYIRSGAIVVASIAMTEGRKFFDYLLNKHNK